MNYRVVKVKKIVGVLVVGIFSLCLASSTLAQGAVPPGAGAPVNINPKMQDRSRQVEQSKLRTAEMNAVIEDQNHKRLQATIVNIKQDFTRIQVLRNDIARNLIAQKPLDYSLIREQTAEINRRAQRLNVYMLAHPPESKEETTPQDPKSEEMVDSLVKLCKLIDSFTENPALKNAAIVDAKEIEKAKEDKTRADRDLLAILKLSESIQKKSDSLRTPK